MQPRQIMLVDDEPRLLSALRRRLSSSFDIVTFERGDLALEYLSQPNNVAVIVADMQMPEMNGVDLLKTVGQRYPAIRRLMLTGNSDQETAVAAINEGKVFRFIRKPCDAMVLKDILNEALEEFKFNAADLTQIKKAEPRKCGLAETQKTFLSIMSDELRTPLSQIITISKILTERHKETDEATLDKFLNQISVSGTVALSHIDRILRFTHLQSSELDAKREEETDVVSTLRAEVALIEAAVNRKLMTISVESLWKSAMIHASPAELSSAFREVLQNAVKYSDIGGHVSVIFRYDKDKIAVRISNSGEAHNAPRDRKISGTFKHATTGLDGESSGMGLGLSLVNLIAERNNVVFNLKEKDCGGAAATFVFKRSQLMAAANTLRLAS